MTKEQAREVLDHSYPCGDERYRNWWGAIECPHDFCRAWMDAYYVYHDKAPASGLESFLLAVRYWGMELGLYSGRGLLDWFMNWLWVKEPYDRFIYQGRRGA